MSGVLINVGIVLLLVLIEGVFVAAEISLVSLRESQVRAMQERGSRGERVAKLVANPNRFLSSVQLGVTLTALLSSAFGAVTLSHSATNGLKRAGLQDTLAGILGFLAVTVTITYVTLVVAELAPKRLALQRAEGAAQIFAPFLDRIASIARPVIWLLSRSTDGVVRLLGGDPGAQREQISDEELRGLVSSHEGLSSEERRIVDEVFAAAERTVREVMVPRTEVDFLVAATPVGRAVREVGDLPHSRYPVVGESQDDVVGFVHLRDLIAATRPPVRRGVRIGDLAREIKRLTGTQNVLSALSEMRREGAHVAVVVDEYGGTAGIVTLEDLIEEVIGDIRDEYDDAERASDARLLRGGDVEVDGLLNLAEFTEETGVALPEGPYETAAGFVVARLGHLPTVGEAVEVTLAEPNGNGHSHGATRDEDAPTSGGAARLSVSRLEGRRIARLRVTLLDLEDPGAHGDPGEASNANPAGTSRLATLAEPPAVLEAGEPPVVVATST